MHRTRLTCLLLVALLAACADEGPVSGPGTMTALLTSPNGPEGAAVVVLVGEGLGAVTPVGDAEVHSQAGVGATQVVVISPAGGALSFRVEVADTTQPPDFLIQQVAGPDDVLRADLSGYSLEVVR